MGRKLCSHVHFLISSLRLPSHSINSAPSHTLAASMRVQPPLAMNTTRPSWCAEHALAALPLRCARSTAPTISSTSVGSAAVWRPSSASVRFAFVFRLLKLPVGTLYYLRVVTFCLRILVCTRVRVRRGCSGVFASVFCVFTGSRSLTVDCA